MRSKAGKKLGVVIVAALVATTLSGVADSPVGADPCPVVATGHATGSGYSTTFAVPFTLDSNFSVDSNGVLTGTTSVNGGPAQPLSGSVSCADITFGTVAPASTFTGTIAPDGRSSTGTYTAPGDVGTWTATTDPYVLTATSTVQPTTIAPLAASSWVIDVQNTGTGAATLVDVAFQITGSGTFGALSQSSVSQGSGSCTPDEELSNVVHCQVGTILPGATASATVPVVSTGGAGTTITLDGFASSLVGGGTDDSTSTVVISVVAPAALPAGTVSGIARPGVSFDTPAKKATPEVPIVVRFKLPKTVAAGTTTLALSKHAGTLKKRAIGGVSLASSSTGKQKTKKAGGVALGMKKVAKVVGPSVPMSIDSSSAEAADFCGGAECSGDVIHLTSFSGYNDPKHPAKLTITWDKSRAGRGVGSTVFKRADARTSPTQTLPLCIKTSVGYINTPCISKRKLVAGGDVQFTMRVLSGDPKFGRR